MPEVLFVSKPVAPPWNDSSKNLVRDVAGHLQRYTPVLLGRCGQPSGLERVRTDAIYPAAKASAFAPGLRDNLAVFRRLLFGSRPALWHFFFAPNPRSSRAGGVATAVRRVPSVHTVCSVPAQDAPIREILFADVTVVLSQATYEAFGAAGVPAEAVRLIPPCIPPLALPSEPDRRRLREAHSLPHDVPILIYPGDLEFGRGAEVALGALASWGNREAILLMACRRKTPKADLIVEQLQAQARQWGIEGRVRWVGETRQIHELLAASDIVLLASDTAYAKMDYPLVALESMCLGRPVLLGRGTPSAELARDGAALAVEVDADAVAAVLESVTVDAARVATLQTRARQAVISKFSPPEVASAYEMLYEEVCA